MAWSPATWWQRLTVRHKVWAVIVLLLIPLLFSLAVHLYVTSQLLAIQQERQSVLLAREYVHIIHRLAIDGEDAYHGYLDGAQAESVAAFQKAESELAQVLRDVRQASSGRVTAANELRALIPGVEQLQASLHALLVDIEGGRPPVFSGHLLSDALRKNLRTIEDRLDVTRRTLNQRAERLSAWTFAELWCALGSFLVLAWFGSRLLVRSITHPLARLQTAAAGFGGATDPTQFTALLPARDEGTDELGTLARAYHDMALRIGAHIRELETLETIGTEINAIGPDGLDGVLRRITDRAAEMVQADVCLVLLRNERMGCWVVEAASGEWNDRLSKSVMLWEEFPICAQAYEERRVAYAQDLQQDCRPQVVRRNVIGRGMVVVPLLSQGQPFGVLALLSRAERDPSAWNVRLAIGLAQQAATAISNARLYEAVQQRQQGLVMRMKQLELLAESLAHDLKGPGARMGELARLFVQQYGSQTDERAARWLRLIEENGEDIARRVEGILSVARIGVGQGAVTAVDPSLLIREVVKARADDIDRGAAVVRVQPGLPMVACHGTYLRQVFDNLLSNALKYAHPGRPAAVDISCEIDGHWVRFTVRDDGPGIPDDQRARVFEPFVRLRRSEAPGSGIGLTIVRRIVELYGGTVWIDGAGSDGCTVRFTMPLFRDVFSEQAPDVPHNER